MYLAGISTIWLVNQPNFQIIEIEQKLGLASLDFLEPWTLNPFDGGAVYVHCSAGEKRALW